MAKNTVVTSKAKKSAVLAKGDKDVKGVKPASKPGAISKKSAVKKGAKANVVAAKPVKTSKSVAPLRATLPVRNSPLDPKLLAQLKDTLIKMRDRLTGQITAQSDDSLKYVDDTSSEDRTDDFDREFALNLVSSEHDSVFEINNALRRIADGSYGYCDGCNCAIEKPRLHALPFARMCIKCQSEQEKGRTRFRPFGDTLAQGVEQAPEVTEPEDTE